MLNTMRVVAVCAVTFACGYWTGGGSASQPVSAQAAGRVFEMRTYTAPEGKLGDLQARFRNHTAGLFEKHGITNIAYWVPQDAPRSQNTLIYVIAYPSREEAKARWAKFQSDPVWQKARTESEVNGRIVERVESVFMTPTDFSKIK
jgi:hypothetical protein